MTRAATVEKPGGAVDRAATAPTTLAQALCVAQRAVQGVAKESFNSFNRYKYASADAIVQAARDALLEAGVVVSRTFTVEATDITDDRVDKDSGESIQNPVYLISSTFKIEACGESRDCTMPWYAITDKGRPIDKALAGALTVSLSYFLRDLLLIPREEEEGSQDRRDDRTSQGTTARPAAAQQRRSGAAPKGATLGPGGAGKVRRLVKEAGLTISALYDAIRRGEGSVAEDMADWPDGWMQRIEQWVAAQKGRPAGAAAPRGASDAAEGDDGPHPGDEGDLPDPQN